MRKASAPLPGRRAFAAIALLAIALRVWASHWDPPLHADEYFQYLEPAWWHWTGVGSETWEWRDGLRSWVLPFYHGAWIAFLDLCGVSQGRLLTGFIRAQWALINSALIWLAFRAGGSLSARLAQAAERERARLWGGLLAALLCAGFAPLVLYAGHVLSEMPSMLSLLAGLVISGELAELPREQGASRRGAVLAGALLALGACLRIANAPLVLVPVVWLLARRRLRELALLIAAALLVVVAFGLVDLATWGGFASSFVAYLRFNLVEGKAANFGTEPASWYVHLLFELAPLGLPALLIVAVAGWRATWPYLLSDALLISYLSTQPHKEARFIIGFWPPLLIACAGSLGAWAARAELAEQRLRALAGPGLVLAIAALVLVDGLGDATHNWFDNERIDAIAWVGRQRDLTGFMVDDAYALSSPDYGSRAPKLQYDAALLGNDLVSHLLLPVGAGTLRGQAESAGFEVVRRGGRYLVLRRRTTGRRAERG